MVEATSQKEFQILPRDQIIFNSSHRRDVEMDRLYMCVKLNGRYKWQPLLDVSQKNLALSKKTLSNSIKDLIYRGVTENEHPCIEIKNAIGNNASLINGIYQPMVKRKKHGEPHFPYRKINGENDKYLYCVKHNNEWKWWLGNRDNYLQRKAWGWLREEKDDTSSNFELSWNVRKWLCWQNPNGQGSWAITSSLITQMTKKSKMERDRIAFMEDCSNQVKKMKSDCENKIIKAEESLQTHRSLSTYLFNNISKEGRQKIMEDDAYKHIFKKKDLCPHCFESSPTIKCIHHDCIGACKKCRESHQKGGGGDGTCFACGKEQKLECPICMESHPIEYLNVFKCKHAVCWKCFCKSYEANRQLKKCPMCREKI